MSNTYTQEALFQQTMRENIAPWWHSRQQGYHVTRDHKQLYWCSMTAPQHTKAIVVVNGRIESVSKYQELFYDLFQQGYDIYSFDHRGQGLSDRLTVDPQMGYIEHFDDYVKDMNELIISFQLAHYQRRYLLAHSMGGAITLRYLQSHQTLSFDAVALSAPMLGIHMSWHLRPIALLLTRLLSHCQTMPNYAPGYGPYLAKPFVDNPLTHSEVRYQWFRELYEQHPELQLGGPSSRWVWQSLLAIKHCFQHTQRLKLPLLLLQAGQDSVVCNRAQTRFMNLLAQQQRQSSMDIIAGARHELLFETDRYRNLALDQILDFFATSHQSTKTSIEENACP